MNKYKSDLLRLLNYLHDQLSESEIRLVKDKIESDNDFRNKLEQLHIATASLDQSAEFQHYDAFEMDDIVSSSAEITAAFIEQRLRDDAMARFEAKCWNSQRVLLEVISNHRFLSGYDGNRSDVQPNMGLDSRLMEIVSNELPSNSDEYVPSISAGPAALENQIRTWKSLAAIAAALAFLATATAIWFSLSSTSQPVEQRQAINQPSNSSSAPETSNNLVADDTSQPASEFEPQSDGVDIVDGEAPLTATDSPRRIIATASQLTFNADERYQLISLKAHWSTLVNWSKELHGVVLKREPIGKWYGLNSEQDSIQPTDFVSLEDSWATAEIPGFGRIVLAAKSHLRVYQTDDSQPITFELLNGQFEIIDLAQGTEFYLRKSEMKILVQVAEDNTSLNIGWSNRALETFVNRGEIKTKAHNVEPKPWFGDDKYSPDKLWTLRKHQKRLWGPYIGIERPISVLRPKIRISRRTFPFDDETVQELNHSSHPLKLLFDLSSSSHPKEFEFASRSIISLDPEKQFSLFLGSEEFNKREAAMDWLLATPTRAISSRMAFKSLNVEKVPDADRLMLFSMLYKKRSVGLTMVNRTVKGLNSPHRGFRHACLSTLKRVIREWPEIEYSIDASMDERTIAVEKWLKHVERLSRYTNTSVIDN